MKQLLGAFFAGSLFGLGLALAQMTDPTVVLGFLDVFGDFNPTLAIVLASAVGTAMLGFHFTLRRRHPVLTSDFHVPHSIAVDKPLLLGAALFGIGWGLAGYCPGPALVSAANGVGTALLFVPAMLVGSLVQRVISRRQAPRV